MEKLMALTSKGDHSRMMKQKNHGTSLLGSRFHSLANKKLKQIQLDLSPEVWMCPTFAYFCKVIGIKTSRKR